MTRRGHLPWLMPPQEEMVHLLRKLIGVQREREDQLVGELRSLKAAVQTASQPPSPASRQRQQPPLLAARKDPKLFPFQEGEDMENYLLRFERIAKTWVWPEEEWACRLVPLLTGKALAAYSSMDEEHSDSYPDLKQALLAKFNISAETYRQRFRDTAGPPNEAPAETYQRLKGLYQRWIKPEQSRVEDIGEAIILEQLLRVFPPEVRTWVKEGEPTNGLEAAKKKRGSLVNEHFSSSFS